MNPLLGFLLRMPLTLFVGGLDLFLKTMRDFQTTYDQTTETLIIGTGEMLRGGAERVPRGDAQNLAMDAALVPSSTPTGPPAPEAERPANAIQATLITPTGKEHQVSDWNREKDLSGDELKFVSYSIIFTKRDFEATLQGEREELVDWATDEGGFAALKISDFLDRLARGRDIPYEWRGGNHPSGEYGYDDDEEPDTFSRIPNVDRKYINFILRVRDRRPRAEQEYDKEQTRAQQELADNIRRLADNI